MLFGTCLCPARGQSSKGARAKGHFRACSILHQVVDAHDVRPAGAAGRHARRLRGDVLVRHNACLEHRLPRRRRRLPPEPQEAGGGEGALLLERAV